MRRYLTRLISLLIFIFLVVTAFTVVLNIFLAASKNTLLRAAGKYFPQKLSIERIFFLPPDFIFLGNSSLAESTSNTSAKPRPSLTIPLILLRLSWQELIRNKRLMVYNAAFYRPRIDYDEFCTVILVNFRQIVEFIRHLTRQDIAFSIKEAELESSKAGEGPSLAQTKVSLNLIVKGERILGSGSVGKPIKSRNLSLPLEYSFKGTFVKDGLLIENIEFKREDLYLDLWGDFKGKTLQLNGYSFLESSLNDRNHQDLNKRRSRYLSKSKISLPPLDLSGDWLRILGLDCRLDFSFPRIHLERLRCTVNDNPLNLKGDIIFSSPISFALALSCRLKNASAENFEDIELKLDGNLDQGLVKTNVEIGIDFIQNKDGGYPLEKFKIGFKGLNLHFIPDQSIKMDTQAVDLFFLTKSNTYRILLSDFNAKLYPKDKRYESIEFQSLFYDGFLKGQGQVDVTSFPVKAVCDLNVEGASANKLEGILVHFSKVYGTLSSQMHFESYPQLCLNGKMQIGQGSLKNFEFFRWLSDSFNIPALKRVDFNRLSSNFTVDAQGASLNEISLDSKDVDLNGYFSLGSSDLVSSKIYLTLTKELLAESSKFAALVKVLGSNTPSLTFNFQLSGILHRMNFQWLKSDLKKRLQDAIPDFIERKIEKNIEDIVDFTPLE